MKKTKNPRESAFLVIYRVFEKNEYVTVSLDNEINKNIFSTKDKALLTQIVYGTIKMKRAIDYIIAIFLKKDINDIDRFILSILRISVYQIFYLDRIPVYSVINEAVNLAKKHRSKLGGLVNGVLRNIDRKKESIEYENKIIELSYEDWMADKWIKEYGEDFAYSFMEKSNEEPYTCIRINEIKADKKEVLSKLEDEGYKPIISKLNNDSIILASSAKLLQTKMYKKGQIFLIDTSSVIASSLLDVKPEDTVLDMCSAPGGKTFCFANNMKNKGIIIARDLYENKIKQMNESKKRLGANIVKTELKDATYFFSQDENKFDKVLTDVPCTNYGIIRRKPDIKWNRKKEDVKKLIKIQRKILENGFKYLKPGGILVYSTCTIEKEENEYQIEKFIEDTIDARLVKYNKQNKYLKLYPNLQNTDGFYAAKIEKVKK